MIRDIPSNRPPARPDFKAFRAPDKSHSKVAYLVWRVQMWVEGTFGLAVLEPWEKLLLLLIFLMTCILLVTGITRYLPQHILDLKGRMEYYLIGDKSTNGPGRSILQLRKNVASGGNSEMTLARGDL
ncbi:hypothetical protein GGU10DRAFT_353438 [Lentinula aff. detonsa]|uniref:Uncharacterized protein n=1 Tax=Lentinula aff. detonsa TaxID=2804958 RepID=A0AA38KWE8_9AGAR|nr:hypothetical protein GGU10DRAFT_353438 [Lentinula aff. detonsa]